MHTAPVLTRRGRTWATVAGALVLGAAVVTPTLATSQDLTLRATADRFVAAFNHQDWQGVASATEKVCRAQAYANALSLAHNSLVGATARVLDVDDAAHTTTLEADYPATGQMGDVRTTSWFQEDGRWVTHLDGCSAPMLSAQGAKNAAFAMDLVRAS